MFSLLHMIAGTGLWAPSHCSRRRQLAGSTCIACRWCLDMGRDFSSAKDFHLILLAGLPPHDRKTWTCSDIPRTLIQHTLTPHTLIPPTLIPHTLAITPGAHFLRWLTCPI